MFLQLQHFYFLATDTSKSIFEERLEIMMQRLQFLFQKSADSDLELCSILNDLESYLHPVGLKSYPTSVTVQKVLTMEKNINKIFNL
jgi:hypothetical protein